MSDFAIPSDSMCPTHSTQAAPGTVATSLELDPSITDSTANAKSMDVADARSWVFRFGDGIVASWNFLFGIVSVIVLLAVTASIPIVQFLSFGYLLEVSGRLARGQRFRDAMIGLPKARVLGSMILGTWLCLLPVRLLSGFWFQAYLIEPTSSQTTTLRAAQLILLGLTLAHLAAAFMCGGKLRYFLWPLIAPFSFGVWTIRRLAGAPLFRKLLNLSLNWISPSLADDICQVKPIGDWFLPALGWKQLRSGGLYRRLRDRVWDFAASLRPGYYFALGAKGFLGTLLWLLLPTGLLVINSYSEGGVAVLTLLAGVLFAIPIFSGLPFLQAHFATDGKLSRFAEPRKVMRNFGQAPIAHVLALLIVLVLALPLFLLKVEQIPGDLLWSLSLIFVVFSWPARLITGWAYRRGTQKERLSRWWIRFPLYLAALPISFAFVMIFTGTRYISWHGALSLFENHVFLLPAPFWL